MLSVSAKMDAVTNVWALLAPKLATFGNLGAQLSGDDHRSVELFSTLESKVRSIGQVIRKHMEFGGASNRIVVLKIANPLFVAPMLLAFWKNGVACALLNPECKQAELKQMQEVTASSFLIEDEPQVAVWMAGVVIKGMSTDLSNALQAADQAEYEIGEDRSEEQPNLDDVALILSSSGSTGLPKGVALSHRNLIAVLQDSSTFVEKGSRALCVLPLCHAFGLVLMLMCLKEGALLVLMRKFNLKNYFFAASRHKVDTLFVVPPILKMICDNIQEAKRTMTQVTKILTGASHVKAEWQRRVADNLPLRPQMCHSYGLTETTFTVLAGESRADKPGSPGKVCRGFSCKVVDPSSGERLSANQTGELLVKSDSVMLGYVNNPAASAEAFRDGWLRTGDLCFFDPEGYFFVVDRIKDVIKFNSHQISPAELEGVVARVAGVLDVAVVGVPHPSHGETPHALVVRQDHSDLTEAKVMQAVSESVSAYKQLHCVTFVNQLPKTLSGKIQRKKALALIYPARDRIPSALDTPQKSAQHPSEDNS